ncbi:hypothetical protein CSKR_111209, partial [Clonorchis sinensis]
MMYLAHKILIQKQRSLQYIMRTAGHTDAFRRLTKWMREIEEKAERAQLIVATKRLTSETLQRKI